LKMASNLTVWKALILSENVTRVKKQKRKEEIRFFIIYVW